MYKKIAFMASLGITGSAFAAGIFPGASAHNGVFYNNTANKVIVITDGQFSIKPYEVIKIKYPRIIAGHGNNRYFAFSFNKENGQRDRGTIPAKQKSPEYAVVFSDDATTTTGLSYEILSPEEFRSKLKINEEIFAKEIQESTGLIPDLCRISAGYAQGTITEPQIMPQPEPQVQQVQAKEEEEEVGQLRPLAGGKKRSFE